LTCEVALETFSDYKCPVATNPSKQVAYKMSPEEVVAVKEGMAALAKGKFLNEEQFKAEMSRYMERRQADIETARSTH
jgi:hypothetical protein